MDINQENLDSDVKHVEDGRGDFIARRRKRREQYYNILDSAGGSGVQSTTTLPGKEPFGAAKDKLIPNCNIGESPGRETKEELVIPTKLETEDKKLPKGVPSLSATATSAVIHHNQIETGIVSYKDKLTHCNNVNAPPRSLRLNRNDDFSVKHNFETKENKNKKGSPDLLATGSVMDRNYQRIDSSITCHNCNSMELSPQQGKKDELEPETTAGREVFEDLTSQAGLRQAGMENNEGEFDVNVMIQVQVPLIHSTIM